MIIAVVAEKGGVGKTTLSFNLAARAAKDGRVLLVDADPMRSASAYTKIRAAQKKEPLFDLAVWPIKENIISVYDTIVIDTGGRDSEEMRRSLMIANIAIIPVVPSQLDLAAHQSMIKIVQSAKKIKNFRDLSVISRAPSNPMLNKEIKAAQEFLDEGEVANTVIYDRIAWKRAAQEGLWIEEIGEKKALLELEKLYEEITKNKEK